MFLKIPIFLLNCKLIKKHLYKLKLRVNLIKLQSFKLFILIDNHSIKYKLLELNLIYSRILKVTDYTILFLKRFLTCNCNEIIGFI